MPASFTKLLLLTILWCVTATLPAQIPPLCSSTPDQGSPSCTNACASCIFEPVQGSTADNTLAGGLPPFCGTFENPEWFRFVAGATGGNLVLAPGACVQNEGLDVAVYASCGAAPLFCQLGVTATLVLPLSGLEMGKDYLIVVDGSNGDLCDYELSLEGNLGVAPPVTGMATVQGPNISCPGGTETYCISLQNTANAAYVTLDVPFGGLINGLPSPQTLLVEPDPCVEITFSTVPGSLAIAATPANACQIGDPAFKSVTIQPTPNTIWNPIYVSIDDAPYFHELSGNIIPAVEGTYPMVAVLESYHGCDSIVRQTVIITPPEGIARCLVFWDSNNNGTQNGNEPAYPFGLILSASNGEFATTGPDGRAVFQNLTPGDTIFATALPPGVTSNPPFRIYQFPGPPLLYTFGLYPSPTGTDLNTTVGTGQTFRPGFETTVNVRADNPQGYNGSVTVRAVKPGWLEYISATPMPNQILGDTLVWNVFLSGNNFSAMVTYRTPVNTPLGTSVSIRSTVTQPPSDLNPYNNVYVLTRTVVGSYDPNDKQVWPQYLLPGDFETPPALEYTIRFQNTGTYPAEFVRLIDTLQESLDPATFEFITSSHPCTWKVYGNGILEFFFDNIQLPDSLSDPEGSIGYATFRIKPRGSLEFGDVVENFADIYFDFNTPIRTNTAQTKAVYFIPGDGLAGEGMRVRPNPAAFFARFSWLTPLPDDGVLRLIGMDGIPRTSETVPAGETTWLVEVQNLPPGMYVAALESGSTLYVRQLVVIEAAETRSRN